MLDIRIHPALTHFPIAFLIGSGVAALLYLYWRRLPELRLLFRMGLLIGFPALLLSIISGIIDQGGLAPDGDFRTVLNWHTGLGLALALLCADLLYRSWIFRTNREDDSVSFLDRGNRIVLTVELLLIVLIVIVTSWLGGQLVYEWGIGVSR